MLIAHRSLLTISAYLVQNSKKLIEDCFKIQIHISNCILCWFLCVGDGHLFAKCICGGVKTKCKR